MLSLPRPGTIPFTMRTVLVSPQFITLQNITIFGLGTDMSKAAPAAAVIDAPEALFLHPRLHLLLPTSTTGKYPAPNLTAVLSAVLNLTRDID